MVKTRYFYFIDLLRWFAAMGVLIHHYSAHFLKANIDIQDSKIFNLIIDHSIIGSYGVWFFWCISGFVFAYILTNTKLTLYNFSIKRFSRLYPLHFVTLLIVALLEIFSFIKFGNYQIGSNIYDFYHFILNLFFISEWGLQDGYSFNNVIWSVSIEIPVYFFFFFIMFFIKKNHLMYMFILLIFSMLLLHSDFYHYQLKSCFFFFILGSFLHFFCLKFQKYVRFFIIVSILGIISCPAFFMLENIESFKKFKDFIPTTLILFSSLIIFAFFIEDKFYKIGKNISFLGNASYAIYLVHLPLQIILLILSNLGMFEIKIFYSLNIFLLFLLAVNFAGIFSYKYFENPARKFIFNYLNTKK